MKMRIALVIGSLWFAGAAIAQDELPPARNAQAVEFKDRREKASYGFGYQIGHNLHRMRMDLSWEMLVRGLQTGLRGEKPAAPEQELLTAMQEHERVVRTKVAATNKQEGEAFLKANKEKPGVTTLDSGLQYQVLQEGKGPKPKVTDRVRTHYHGTLIDGTVFDSSVERGEPVTFGVSEVIPGWSEALQLMSVGSKWRLFVPSELAYGVQGAGPDIGPNSVLIFEVELLGIEQ